MARTLNKVILVGRLGADPDVRYMQDGTAVVNFNIATDEPVRVGEGSWESRAEWHRIVAYRRLAELCANYLSKGQLVCVEGKLRTRQWDDNQGVRRYTTEVIARDIVFMGGGADQSANAQTTQSSYTASSGGGDSMVTPGDQEVLPEVPTPPDDDIPF